MSDEQVSRYRAPETGPRDVAIDEETDSGIVISPHSEWGKELLKWEQYPGPLGRKPGNPYVYREYPRMLYRAERHPETGQPTCVMGTPHPYDYSSAELHAIACQKAEHWNKGHQKIVGDETALLIAKGQGWCLGPKEALEQFEKDQIAVAEAAANVAFQAQRMSEKARAELAQAHTETDAHVVDVQPRKQRGRPRKPKAITAAGEVEE